MRKAKLIEETDRNRAILRIWDESAADALHRFCRYARTQISAAMLFDGGKGLALCARCHDAL